MKYFVTWNNMLDWNLYETWYILENKRSSIKLPSVFHSTTYFVEKGGEMF